MSDPVLIRCIGCGVPLGNKVPSQGAIEHARTCPEHPLAAEFASLRARATAAEALADRLAYHLGRVIAEVEFKLSGGDAPAERCKECGEYGAGMLRDAVKDAKPALAAHAAAKDAAATAPDVRTRSKVQPCGCVVCTCDTEERCLGCGAKRCGTPECVFEGDGSRIVYDPAPSAPGPSRSPLTREDEIRYELLEEIEAAFIALGRCGRKISTEEALAVIRQLQRTKGDGKDGEDER